MCCCWYHKGTNFQANHNPVWWMVHFNPVVADTTKVRIFKQITTYKWVMMWGLSLLLIPQRYEFSSKSQHYDAMRKDVPRCCWYHKGTNFQANHNLCRTQDYQPQVVADTTKVRIFKQITTQTSWYVIRYLLLLIPQRYEFSSKSQHGETQSIYLRVVADTTKVRIFKQITTGMSAIYANSSLLLIPQRYEFSSKSQPLMSISQLVTCCCWYHKGTNFQANHNYLDRLLVEQGVVADTTKVRIFKQITT